MFHVEGKTVVVVVVELSHPLSSVFLDYRFSVWSYLFFLFFIIFTTVVRTQKVNESCVWPYLLLLIDPVCLCVKEPDRQV